MYTFIPNEYYIRKHVLMITVLAMYCFLLHKIKPYNIELKFLNDYDLLTNGVLFLNIYLSHL